MRIKISRSQHLNAEKSLDPPNDDGGILRDQLIEIKQNEFADLKLDEIFAAMAELANASSTSEPEKKAIFRAILAFESALKMAAELAVDIGEKQ